MHLSYHAICRYIHINSRLQPITSDPIKYILLYLSLFFLYALRQIYGKVTAMASYRKRLGAWEVSVSKLGIRKSATFDTKSEAQKWAAKIETEISDGKYALFADKTLGDLLIRYGNDVSVKKAGGRRQNASG